MKKTLLLTLFALLTPVVWSQDTIYRCGNEYTNNAAQAKAGNCKPVEGGQVTVIHGGRPPVAASGTAPAGAAPARPAAASPAAGSPAPARVDNSAQRARDADARAILDSELAKAQERLSQLQLEYNNGNPNRTALELRNPQGYQERVDQIKASIARQESDIAGIRREIGRLPSN